MGSRTEDGHIEGVLALRQLDGCIPFPGKEPQTRDRHVVKRDSVRHGDPHLLHFNYHKALLSLSLAKEGRQVVEQDIVSLPGQQVQACQNVTMKAT